MSDYSDLSVGEFLYQSDQELFLVVSDESEESYRFSVHGWRTIDKDRVEEYVSHDNGKLYSKEQIEEFVKEEGNEQQVENYTRLKEIFNSYTDVEMGENGPHKEFSLDEP